MYILNSELSIFPRRIIKLKRSLNWINGFRVISLFWFRVICTKNTQVIFTRLCPIREFVYLMLFRANYTESKQRDNSSFQNLCIDKKDSGRENPPHKNIYTHSLRVEFCPSNKHPYWCKWLTWGRQKYKNTKQPIYEILRSNWVGCTG